MKTLILLFIISSFPLSCYKDKIHNNYDDFGKKQKRMLEQIYFASKDFSKNQEIRIKYCKEIDKNGEYSISGKISFLTNLTEGKLESTLLIKLNNELYETHFYEAQATRTKQKQTKSEHLISYENDKSSVKNQKEKTGKHISSEIFTQTITENTYISNIAYFNLQDMIIHGFLSNENLSFRFKLGNESVRINLANQQIKALKEFIQSDG